MKKLSNKTIICKSIIILFMSYGSGHALDFRTYPELVELADTMVREDGYPRAQLEATFAEAVIDPSVIRAMEHQYEALPWHQYRKRFINDERIRKGVSYWNRHQAVLREADRRFGVPPAVIVALIGVETHFGDHMGDKRVLDSLVTLTAAYPRRSAYFSRELRAFLNTVRAENIAPGSVTGSFAGAVGIPQFMPTSYQVYAVDLNQNGRRDLVNETEDAIGSVANYLKQRGWREGQGLFASLPNGIPQTATGLVSKRAKPRLTAEQLAAAGIEFAGGDALTGKVALLRLQEERGYRYIIGFNNFHVITRYNPSINYAMVVSELSREISRQRIQ